MSSSVGRVDPTEPPAEGSLPMQLTTVTNVSLDAVTDGHRRIRADTRDRTGSDGFGRVGCGPPLFDDAASTYIPDAYLRADALMLGRRTYEISSRVVAGSLR